MVPHGTHIRGVAPAERKYSTWIVGSKFFWLHCLLSNNGKKNNIHHVKWGSTGESLTRLFGYHYPYKNDIYGKDWDNFSGRPSCCKVEESLIKTKKYVDIPSCQGLSLLTMFDIISFLFNFTLFIFNKFKQLLLYSK